MSFVSAWRAFSSALKGSPNVWRIMLFTFLYNCAIAVWMNAIWPPFLKAVFSSNASLGWIACGSGVAELVAAVSSGLASDKIGRNLVLRVAAVIMMLSSAGMSVGIYFEHFASVVAAGVGVGAAYGAFFPVVEALFADSVTAGNRTEVYSVKYSLETASGLLGVVVALVMFAVMGDEWEVGTMRVVIWSGLGLTALCSLLLWTVRSELALEQIESDVGDDDSSSRNVDDDRVQTNNTEVVEDEETSATQPLINNQANNQSNSNGEHAAARARQGAHHGSAPRHRTACDTERAHDAHSDERASESHRSPARDTENHDEDSGTNRRGDREDEVTAGVASAVCEDGYDPQHFGVLHSPLRFTPHLLSSIGVCLCLGSGMTVMFFNLFLIQEFDTSPVQLQILTAAIVITNVAFGQLLALADSFGWNRFRIQVPPTTLGVAGIGILAVVSSGPLAQMWPTYIIFALRKAGMNCCTGVVRALTMDIVPKSQRGRWNALESLMSATWATSAVIGGYVADATSYRQAFMITFAFHGAALGILLLMFRNRDPREWLKSDKEKNDKSSDRDTDSKDSESAASDIDTKVFLLRDD